MIQLKNIERSYKTAAGQSWVLRRVNLEIRQGEFVTFIAAASRVSAALAGASTRSIFAWPLGKMRELLEGIYDEPELTVISAEVLQAITSHRDYGKPLTIEAGIVRVADALDMARGRSRVPFEAGQQNIHSLSAYAIEEVKISAGRGDKPVRVEILMSNSAGIFQVDELLATKLRGSGLEEYIEVVARIEAEHEERLIPVFRI